MHHLRSLGTPVLLGLAVLAVLRSSAAAQQRLELDAKQMDAIRAAERTLNDFKIDAGSFSRPTPLAKLLLRLEQLMPEDRRIVLRIDKEAFGDDYDEVAATPVTLPTTPRQIDLMTILRLARSKIKSAHAYRIGAGEFVITTPQRALYAVAYDIRDLLQKLEVVDRLEAQPWNAFRDVAQRRALGQTEKAAQVVKAILAAIDGIRADATSFEQSNLQVVNGAKLVIRATAEQHDGMASVLNAFRRLGDLSIIVNTNLYEVDDAAYTKLKHAKPVDWEEQERILLGQLPAKPAESPSLFDVLDKQKPVQTGNEVKIDDGLVATLLARQHAVAFGPNREQVIGGQKERQSVLFGVAFTAGMRVSPDRRSVRVQLHEKAAEVRQVKKVKVMVSNDGKEVDVEIPFTQEASHQREFEIPDGGTMLVPVHYRPKALADKNRWWVLHIQPRIWIEEEEKAIREHALAELLPVVVADVLANPRLRANRELYGTAGDKRFALLDSPTWTWTKDFKIDAAGFGRTPAARTGPRLLGIRVERFDEADKEGEPSRLTIALVNAGGNDNGAVVGAGTIRYAARRGDKGWMVELAE